MKKLKGIGLLLLANILIFITLSISFTVLSEFVLPAFGIDLRGFHCPTGLAMGLCLRIWWSVY